MPVDALEDDGVGFEIHVEDAVGDGEVDACCENDEFEEDHSQGTGESYGGHLFEAFFLELDGGEDLGVAGGFAEGGGAAGEQDWAEGFGEEEEGGEGDAGDDETDPECPAPAEGGGDEA